MKSITTTIAGLLLSLSVIGADARPNVIIIYSDDQGWGDVGYHGFKDIMTPNIDRLATGGTWFSQAYVTASVCGPSRSGLLTGIYQQRFGCGENPNIAGFPDKMKFPLAGVPRSRRMLSEMLKERGYYSGHIGKWHLGADRSLRPLARGFDEFFGFINGSHDYTRWDGEFGRNKGQWPLWRGDAPLPARENVYLTDLFSDEAASFVERAADREQPFFLYLAYNAVHHPWQVPDSYLERTKDLSDNAERNFFAAMILAMDDGIGRVQQALKKKGVADSTILIFMSDNGTPRGQGLTHSRKKPDQDWGDGPMSKTGGLRGFKGDTYEGGIRVPLCISWPEKIKPGSHYALPVSALDIVPTILAASGGRPNEQTLDGVDLLPYLNGKPGRPHETLYWRRDNDYAIRYGDWKLQWNDAGSTRNITLFNLADDPHERHDLAAAMPEKAQAMQDLFDAWDSALPDNEWWGGAGNRKRSRIDLSVAEFNARPDKGHFYRKIRRRSSAAPVPSEPGIPLEQRLQWVKAERKRAGKPYNEAQEIRFFNAKDNNKDGVWSPEEAEAEAPKDWNKK
ncbi:MAG: sulfatase-like hydrolase/transferase [Lentisphaerae bacterium]|nr:sulfatase-like hydrolase/transferase [Lentisphaerota bacterium]MBT5605720.1 sulfatase-like hydrolase/transferase [Lentisphaerota bacterium]MBT7055425.1 sulfatase-like hydrolase/transferase [Lentisphaerota bacterium]MBT7844061.1 sulfatase-like hydrolase/transferase [Lentisphaerota bacterium]